MSIALDIYFFPRFINDSVCRYIFHFHCCWWLLVTHFCLGRSHGYRFLAIFKQSPQLCFIGWCHEVSHYTEFHWYWPISGEISVICLLFLYLGPRERSHLLCCVPLFMICKMHVNIHVGSSRFFCILTRYLDVTLCNSRTMRFFLCFYCLLCLLKGCFQYNQLAK